MSAPTSVSVKAWRVVWSRMPSETGIYIAPTRGKAIALAHAAATEAGYRPAWSDLRATRAPEYDEWARQQGEHRRRCGVAEGYVRGQAEESRLQA